MKCEHCPVEVDSEAGQKRHNDLYPTYCGACDKCFAGTRQAHVLKNGHRQCMQRDCGDLQPRVESDAAYRWHWNEWHAGAGEQFSMDRFGDDGYQSENAI